APPTVMAEIWIAVPPAFVIFTDWAAVGTWSVCGEKLMLAGETLIDAIVPVPESATVCGDPPALSENESTADFVPVEAGAKMTLTLHCAFAASVPPFTGQFV